MRVSFYYYFFKLFFILYQLLASLSRELMKSLSDLLVKTHMCLNFAKFCSFFFLLLTLENFYWSNFKFTKSFLFNFRVCYWVHTVNLLRNTLCFSFITFLFGTLFYNTVYISLLKISILLLTLKWSTLAHRTQW